MTSVYEKEVTSHYSKQTISKKTIAVYIVALRYEFYIFPLELTLFYSHLLQKQDLKLYSTFSYFFPFFFFFPPPLSSWRRWRVSSNWSTTFERDVMTENKVVNITIVIYSDPPPPCIHRLKHLRIKLYLRCYVSCLLCLLSPIQCSLYGAAGWQKGRSFSYKKQY